MFGPLLKSPCKFKQFTSTLMSCPGKLRNFASNHISGPCLLEYFAGTQMCQQTEGFLSEKKDLYRPKIYTKITEKSKKLFVGVFLSNLDQKCFYLFF